MLEAEMPETYHKGVFSAMERDAAERVAPEYWWRDYFDEIYYTLYKPQLSEERTLKEVNFIEKTLALKPGELVLDLACGQGRHAIPLASRGYRMVGLDYSDCLLGIAVRSAREAGVDLPLIRGDMRSLPFRELFDVVYIFFTSFGYFSDEDNFQVLREVRRALKPGGRFLLDLWNPLSFLVQPYRQLWELHESLLILEEWHFDVKTFCTFSRRIIYHQGKLADQRSFLVRSYTLPEISWLLREAGFEVKEAYGGYDASPYSKDSSRLIVVAEAQ